MADQEEEGIGADAAPTVGLALSGSKSSTYVLRWALANYAKDKPAPAAFRLIHVLKPVLAVTTPLGKLIPIDEARTEIADDHVKRVELEAQQMLARCKNMCDENKVEAQVMLVNGSDVADTISNLVAQYQIQILVIGGSPTSRKIFTMMSSGNRTSSEICKSVPSFCTVYLVSKDGLSSVYAPGSESDLPSASGVSKGNGSNSSTKVFSDGTSSISDLNVNSSECGLSGFPSLPHSNLASENIESSSSAERHGSFTQYDYLTGAASVYKDNDRRVTSRTGAESSVSSKLQVLEMVPVKESSLQGLMLAEKTDGQDIPAPRHPAMENAKNSNDKTTEMLTCTDAGGSTQKQDILTRGNRNGLIGQTWETMVQCMRKKLKLSSKPASARDIPDDVIVIIFLKLPGKYHRKRMALACKEWGDAYIRQSFMFSAELPWLLLPSSAQPLIHVTGNSTTYSHHFGPDIQQGARFCGSVEGGHVVVALENSGEHILYNLNSRKSFPLPRTIILTNGAVHDIRVEAAIPYGWPNQDKRCIVAAAVTDVNGPYSNTMAYWQPGMEWEHFISLWSHCGSPVAALDILYHSHRQSFMFLTEDLNVHVLKFYFDENDELDLEYEDLDVSRSLLDLQLAKERPCPSQYLIQSGDDVFRISKHLDVNQRTTNMFIYKLEHEVVSDGDTDVKEKKREDSKEKRLVHWWSLPCQLRGRIIFTGRASSRVFEGTGPFCDHILFHDDRPKQNQMPFPGMFDRTDMGMFSTRDRIVRAWPPAGGEEITPVSNMCPSIWWFH